jgi:hypothetical protein
MAYIRVSHQKLYLISELILYVAYDRRKIMKKNYPMLFFLLLSVVTWMALSAYCIAAEGGKLPVGSILPPFKLAAPDGEQALSYLGIKSSDPFSISQLPSRLVLIEAFGAF